MRQKVRRKKSILFREILILNKCSIFNLTEIQPLNLFCHFFRIKNLYTENSFTNTAWFDWIGSNTWNYSISLAKIYQLCSIVGGASIITNSKFFYIFWYQWNSLFAYGHFIQMKSILSYWAKNVKKCLVCVFFRQNPLFLCTKNRRLMWLMKVVNLLFNLWKLLNFQWIFSKFSPEIPFEMNPQAIFAKNHWHFQIGSPSDVRFIFLKKILSNWESLDV